MDMDSIINFEILPQPDDYTCGPTCLHAVYRYYSDTLSLDEVISQVSFLEEGGTLAVQLGLHALRRGYRATIYTYNLQVFDPTWLAGEGDKEMVRKLKEQAAVKKDRKLTFATRSYVEFLERGGRIKLEDLTAGLIRKYLNRSVPILTGLSSTYLYRAAREYGDHTHYDYDDIRGIPQGHFVVLTGYEKEDRMVHVADPYKSNPLAEKNLYRVNIDRLINSILLGILTYDANLLIIESPESHTKTKHHG